MERHMRRHLDGSTTLYENGRTQVVPAGTSNEELVAAMLAFYTPDPEPSPGTPE